MSHVDKWIVCMTPNCNLFINTKSNHYPNSHRIKGYCSWLMNEQLCKKSSHWFESTNSTVFYVFWLFCNFTALIQLKFNWYKKFNEINIWIKRRIWNSDGTAWVLLVSISIWRYLKFRVHQFEKFKLGQRTTHQTKVSCCWIQMSSILDMWK